MKDYGWYWGDVFFQRGALVLMRNIAIEKSFNCKMRPRYLGPYVVLSRNRGGAYIVSELNGAVFSRPVAAFRLIPYRARRAIVVPTEALDITPARLRELEAADTIPEEEEERGAEDDEEGEDGEEGAYDDEA